MRMRRRKCAGQSWAMCIKRHADNTQGKASTMSKRKQGASRPRWQWSEEKEDQLIELWRDRDHSFLYDVSDPRHSDRVAREKSLQEISSALEIPGETICYLLCYLLFNFFICYLLLNFFFICHLLFTFFICYLLTAF